MAHGAAHVGVDCAVADVDGRADFYQLLLTDVGPVIRKASFGDVPAVTLEVVDDDAPLGSGAPGIVAGAAPRDRAPDGAVIRFSSYTVRDLGGAP